MGRLALTIQEGGSFRIGEEIVVDLVWIKGSAARVAIRAPKQVKILRTEVYERAKMQDVQLEDREG